MNSAQRFQDLLEVEKVEEHLFRSTVSGPSDPCAGSALYGGQLAAQALSAAGRTVDIARDPHSLHCYFIAAGSGSEPVEFEVDVLRDGGGFSTRRVLARQDGRVLCSVSASFCSRRDRGHREQGIDMPHTRSPRESATFSPGFLLSVEARDTGESPDRIARSSRFWTRFVDDGVADDPLSHACALVYVSDVAAGSPAAADGSESPQASLDHAMWFHRRVDAAQWALIDLRHIVTGSGRTAFDGQIFAEKGDLLASLHKEELFR